MAQVVKFIGDVQGWLYGGASVELRALAASFDVLKLFPPSGAR
jgi:hypothetical protein